MEMAMETIQVEAILTFGQAMQHNGLTKMGMDMETTLQVQTETSSLLTQHNGPTKMVTDTETIRVELLQMHTLQMRPNG